MHIERLRATNVRCIRTVDLDPGPAFNVVMGTNGSGKTSLLETIFLLGNGRSFRTRRVSELVSRGTSQLTAFCSVAAQNGDRHQIGLERASSASRTRVDRQDIRVTSGLARLLPTVFIAPDCVRLLTDGGDLRRRFLDWILFHVEQSYLDVFQRYQRTLRQRNAALHESSQASALDVWDRQLGELGEQLDRLRQTHVAPIGRFVGEFLTALLSESVDFSYRRGWAEGEGLEEALRRTRGQDLRAGYTRAGPQRADLTLTVAGKPARSVLSRGESRLLAMGLHLAQAAYFTEFHGEPPVVLVDDLGSELDRDNQRRFVATLRSLGGQVFVTTLAEDGDGLMVDAIGEPSAVRGFHVERGKLQPMV